MENEEQSLDTALQLKKVVRDNSDFLPIHASLENSTVIAKLLAEKYRTDTFTGLRKLEFLLAELSEIPFFSQLEKVQVMLETLYAYTNVEEGFSLTGKKAGVLACHNALCTLIFIRGDKKEWAEQGVRWILSYLPFEKDQPSSWSEKDLFQRFGGCLGRSPCYDGLVKSIKVLSEYSKKYGDLPGLQEKKQQGLEYILKHRVIFHQASEEYLYKDLITLFYPYPYRTNIIEVLALLKSEELLNRDECQPALEYLKSKQLENGCWQAEKIFMKSSWVPFDPLKKPGAWITDEIQWLLTR